MLDNIRLFVSPLVEYLPMTSYSFLLALVSSSYISFLLQLSVFFQLLLFLLLCQSWGRFNKRLLGTTPWKEFKRGFPSKPLSIYKHCCIITCRWTHYTRQMGLLHGNPGSWCRIFESNHLIPYFILPPSISKEKQGSTPEKCSASTGCSCCDCCSPQAEVLRFLFHLIHHSEPNRDSAWVRTWNS